ncbi:MAG: N-acetylmuramic acid 6-phosphate etherase [Thermodesulfobacteriota bacterium]
MNISRPTGHLLTEKVNPRTSNIDNLSTKEIVDLIAEEDHEVLRAVSKEKENISKAIDVVLESLNKNGRIFFVGAGTSGRLGVLEAAECPPTFGTDPDMIQAIIAGGKEAVLNSIEGAEDDEDQAKNELKQKELSKKDVVIGIAASSSTPFVKSALEYAKNNSCNTIFITCSPAESSNGVVITLLVGPEVIVGSTRLKSGTATKMVLNMITTASMIKLGKTFGNLMVDVQPKSSKLRDRAARIVSEISGVEESEAKELLLKTEWNVKTAVLMKLKGISAKDSEKLLKKNGGILKRALK